jgi:phage tail-like protein
MCGALNGSASKVEAMRACETNFRHVNRDGEWPDFHWHGLELLTDGTLRLPALPRVAGPEIRSLADSPTAPAGIAIDWDGTLFFSHPPGNRVFRIDGCSGALRHARCLGVVGEPLSTLDTPRGLLIGSHRRVLYVVDAGHHRILALDPESGALHGALGASGLPHTPPPSDVPGRFNDPWALTADADGHVYVVDHGNRRVQKFDATGLVDPLFWNRMRAEGVLAEPADIAAVGGGPSTQLYVLDRTKRRIFQFDQHGQCVRDQYGQPWELSGRLDNAMGLAATSDALYVGDNARRRVLQFRLGDPPSFVGEAVGFEGPVAALLLDGANGLRVTQGGPDAPATLALVMGYGSRGLLWGGPFAVDCPELTWRHVRALATIPALGGHLDLFWRLSPLAIAPSVDAGSDDPFAASAGWHHVGQDLVDFGVSGDRTQRLSIGARFSSDGSATATLSQLRIQFDRDSYLSLLPVIYQEESACGDFFDRFLALFESFMERTEETIRQLPALADPSAIPSAGLPWLASWLGLELDEDWDEQTRRDAIRQAYARYAMRGTPRGLRESIEREAGVPVVVQEPIANGGWWALPGQSPSCGDAATAEWTDAGDSVLGFTTTLVAAEPQGAIVGTTATLDRSHLITDEEFAAPLFDDLAHQVQVLMYPAFAGDDRTVARVREIIEREKPAHVAYHLCTAKPELRVGIQARLGVDTIVSGQRIPTRLEPTGGALVLAGTPAGRVGPENRVGVTSRL